MKQCVISIVVVFVVSMALDFVVHQVLLKADYARQPVGMFRPEPEASRHLPAMLLAHAFIAVGVTSIYRRGREAGKGWLGQGVRFGLWFAVASCIPNFLIYYAVLPIDHIAVLKQVVFGSISMVLIGIVLAGLNKAPA